MDNGKGIFFVVELYHVFIHISYKGCHYISFIFNVIEFFYVNYIQNKNFLDVLDENYRKIW